MQTSIKLGLFALLGILLTLTGCASKKQQRQINALQAQVGVLTDELVTMDSQMRTTTAPVATIAPTGQAVVAPAITPKSSGTVISGSIGQGSTYRTPSGFELPSLSIQQALKSAGYYSGALDGNIGSGTKNAVKSFQRDHGLTADGVVGQQTWNKLKVYLSGSIK